MFKEVQRSSTPGELLIRLQQENEHLRKELDVKVIKIFKNRKKFTRNYRKVNCKRK